MTKQQALEKRYVVYWDHNSVRHYFASFEEAKEYVNRNCMDNARIAKLLAFTNQPPIIELDEEKP